MPEQPHSWPVPASSLASAYFPGRGTPRRNLEEPHTAPRTSCALRHTVANSNSKAPTHGSHPHPRSASIAALAPEMESHLPAVPADTASTHATGSIPHRWDLLSPLV